MKKLLFFILCTLPAGCAPLAFAQNNTTVQGTIVGPNTAPWANATAYAALVCPGNAQAYIGTSPVAMTGPTARFSATGFFSQSLWNTASLVDVNRNPMSCNYQYHVTDQCGQNSFITSPLTGITGAGPVDLSGQINASAPNPCVPGGGAATAGPPPFSLQYNFQGSLGGTSYLYNSNDTSVAFCASTPCKSISANTGLGLFSNTGGLEFLATHVIGGDVTSSNLTSGNCVQAGTGGILTTTSGPCASGTGVTSFSAGNFSPLFNTSVATPTTTPALSFTVLNQGANVFYAGATSGGSTAPAFRNIVTNDLPASLNNCAAGAYAVGWSATTNMNCTTFFSALGSSKIQNVRITSGICTTGSGAETKCTMAGIVVWGVAFSDANYSITCTTTNPTGTGTNPGIYPIYFANKTASGADLILQGGSASAAGNVTVSEIDCIGVHQ